MIFRMCIFRVLHGIIVNGFLLYVVFPRHPCSILMILCLKSCKFQCWQNLCHIFHGKFSQGICSKSSLLRASGKLFQGWNSSVLFGVCFKKHVIGVYRKIIIYFVVDFSSHPKKICAVVKLDHEPPQFSMWIIKHEVSPPRFTLGPTLKNSM